MKLFNSISGKIGFYLVIILLFVTGFLGFFNYQTATDIMTEELEEMMEHQADDVSQRVREKLNTYIDELESLANKDEIMSMDWSVQNDFLQNHLQDSQYTGMALVHHDMTARYTDIDPAYLADNEHIEKALEGEPGLSNITISRLTDQQVILISVPIEDNQGEILGALVGRLEAYELSQLIDGIEFAEEGFAYIINNEGTIMAHQDTDLINTNLTDIGGSEEVVNELKFDDPGNGQIVDSYEYQGDEMHVGYSLIEGTSWLVGITAGRDVIMDNLNELQSMIILSMSLILITGILIATIFGKQIARPIETMAKHAQTVSEGDLDLNISDNLLNRSDELGLLVNSFDNMTENLKKMQDTLEYMAYHDSLTGLCNRSSFQNDFQEFVDREGAGHTKGAVMMLDIDNFKLINDTMGHLYGDKVIQVVGQKLLDITKDLCRVYRMGGDEFIVWCPNIDSNQAKEIAINIMDDFGDSVLIEGGNVPISFSIGISNYPENGQTMDALLRKADIAMYESKKGSKMKYSFYKSGMMKDSSRKMEIERQLPDALENNEFALNYHPQYDSNTGQLWGFEALIRWNNQELGNVPPNEFIEIAEKSHLIIDIGNWVLDNACKFIRSLHDQGYTGYSISVNISVIQLLQEDFAKNVMAIVNKHGLNPSFLEIEITESLMIESFEMVQKKLQYLKEAGMKIALDDFGTGYSSLTYLRSLPFTTLKIDKSFVDGIEDQTTQEELIASIIDIGRTINSEVVAEGVESKEQYQKLKTNNCHRLQGYYFSKPIKEEDIQEFLKGGL